MTRSQTADTIECQSSCAGKATEACGATNRILVYENKDWELLTRPEFVVQIEDYAALIQEFQAEIKKWQDLLEDYQDLLDAQPSGGKKLRIKRQETAIQKKLPEIQEIHDRIISGVGQRK